MKKIEQIVREEQNSIGAQEMLMPTIQSAEIWKESVSVSKCECGCSRPQASCVRACAQVCGKCDAHARC